MDIWSFSAYQMSITPKSLYSYMLFPQKQTLVICDDLNNLLL